MRSFLKKISLVLLLIFFISCGGFSKLFTTNHFEQFEDIDPFSVFASEETSFGDLDYDQKVEIINKYTTAALSIEDSDALFTALKNQPDYRDQVTDFMGAYLIKQENIPDPLSKKYDEDLIFYQNLAVALGRIEVYTTRSIAIFGFNDLFVDYASGEIEETLTQKIFLSEVFGIQRSVSETKVDIEALVRAGEAFELLGKTIRNTDNPESSSLNEDDAILILMSSMMKRIVYYTNLEFPSLNESQIINNLVKGIIDGDFVGLSIKFPQDIVGSKLTNIQRYLGVGGALTFTATGFDLPPMSLFGGNQ